MLAESVESVIHPEHILELSGSEEDVLNPDYILTKLSLSNLVKTNNPIRFAYLMSQRDGKIIILVDSEPPDSPDYSPRDRSTMRRMKNSDLPSSQTRQNFLVPRMTDGEDG